MNEQTPTGRATVMAGSDPRLEENASAKLARKRAEAARAAAARAATPAPAPAVPTEPPPDTSPDVRTNGTQPHVKAERKIALHTTIEHRGRQFTIVAEGMTLDQLCDYLDERGYLSPTPQTWQTLPDGTPLCPKHKTVMKLRQRQGDEWWSHNVGSEAEPCYCRGYRGKNSPGYEK